MHQTGQTKGKELCEEEHFEFPVKVDPPDVGAVEGACRNGSLARVYEDGSPYLKAAKSAVHRPLRDDENETARRSPFKGVSQSIERAISNRGSKDEASGRPTRSQNVTVYSCIPIEVCHVRQSRAMHEGTREGRGDQVALQVEGAQSFGLDPGDVDHSQGGSFQPIGVGGLHYGHNINEDHLKQVVAD